MKRSEMLGDIYNILYWGTDINEDILEQLTLDILDKAEKNGMLPCAEGEWEPENEKN